MSGPLFIPRPYINMKRTLSSLTPLLMAALGLIVYWQGLHGGFIFDDFANLVTDPDWKVTTLDPTDWRRAMALGIASDMGRPLALFSFAINHYFTGLEPFPLKLTNLGFHLLNSVLVFLLCRHLFSLAPARDSAERMGPYAAALVATAWLLHPLQVSSVLYIVQRMEVGAHTGVLLALLCYLRARTNQCAGRRSWPWFALTVLGSLLGLGFKESAALIPGYTLALEFFVLRFRTASTRNSSQLIAAYTMAVVLALAVFLFLLLPKYLPTTVYAPRDFSLIERLLTQLHVLAMYLGQMLLPLPNQLVFYYDNFPISTGLLGPPATLYGLLLLVATAIFAFLTKRRWPLLSLGIAWFFIAHALTSNVIPLELAFEHRNYFALLGILIAVSQVLAWAGKHLHMDARRTLAALPVLLLAGLCAIQSHTWGDPLRLATVLASRNPDSPRAGYDLGLQMLRMAGDDYESPLLSLAIKEFEHAASLPLSSPLPEQALIFVKARAKQGIPRELWDQFRSKLSKRPAGPQEIAALHGVLDCRIQQDCKFDDQQLFLTFITAVEHNPQSTRILSLYANFAYNVLGDPALAITVTRDCIRLAPGEIEYQVNLTRLLSVTGQHPEELAELIENIRASDIHNRYQAELATGFRPEIPFQEK